VGQKTNPYGFRLVYNKTWHSRWYGEANYAKTLHEDLSLRRRLKARLGHAGVSEIDIERAADKLRVTIYTSRPGIIIGRRGAEVDKLRDDLQKEMGREVHINIQEIQRPELDAQLVSESIAGQLERRVSFRRAMKKAMESAFRFGAKGVKIMVSGRLGGAEIARSEWYQEGRLPLHTLKADIDYGLGEAHTTYGIIGVKVWVYKGDLLKEKSRRASA
jgi:small subunit ribosomal protein S3